MTFTVLRIVAIVLGIVGTTFLIPLGTALSLGENEAVFPFLIPMLVSWIFFAVFFFAGKRLSAVILFPEINRSI